MTMQMTSLLGHLGKLVHAGMCWRTMRDHASAWPGAALLHLAPLPRLKV